MSIIIRLQNLPWAANSVDIRRYFAGLSIPEGGVHIVGGEKGDAFIAFSTDEDARLAMEKDGGKIKEMKIKLLLSSRAEMMRVIEQARNQNLALQNSSAVKAAVNDSDRRKIDDSDRRKIDDNDRRKIDDNDRRKIRERSPSPRKKEREREKSPSRDRRRSSSRRDRSRSRSRSPIRRSRDSERRSERSKRDDRRYDEQPRSSDQYKSRDSLPRESEKEKSYMQPTVATNQFFDPRMGATPQTYDSVQLERSRISMLYDSRHGTLPSGSIPYFDARNLSQQLAYSSAATDSPSQLEIKNMNEPLRPPQFNLNIGRLPVQSNDTVGSVASGYEAKRPSPTPATLAPNVGSNSQFTKVFGLPPFVDSYDKISNAQANVHEPLYSKPFSFTSNQEAVLHSAAQTAERGAVPAVPLDRNILSERLPALAIPSYSQKPIYGGESHAKYEQVPEAVQANKSVIPPVTKTDEQINDTGFYGKRLPPNIPTVSASGTGVSVNKPPRRSRFEPESNSREEKFYAAASPENEVKQPHTLFNRPVKSEISPQNVFDNSENPSHNLQKDIKSNVNQENVYTEKEAPWSKESKQPEKKSWNEGRQSLVTQPPLHQSPKKSVEVSQVIPMDICEDSPPKRKLPINKITASENSNNYRTAGGQRPSHPHESSAVHGQRPSHTYENNAALGQRPSHPHESSAAHGQRPSHPHESSAPNSYSRDQHKEKRDTSSKELKNTSHPINRNEPLNRNSRMSSPSLTVEVKGLPFDACDADVVELFRGIFIPPENIRIQLNNHGQPTGNALVKFINLRDFEEGLSRHKKYIGNCSPDVRAVPASVFENAPSLKMQHKRDNALPPRRKLQPREEDLCVELRGLPFSCKEDDVVHFFDGLSILDIEIEQEPNGRASGVGYVEFGSPTDFHAALAMDGKMIGHRYINVFVASKEMIAASRGCPPDQKEREPPFPAGPPREVLNPTKAHQPPPDPPSYCVAINGLPQTVKNRDIADFFSEVNVIPVAIHIMLDQNKLPSGEAFAEFNSVKEFEIGLRRNGKFLAGVPISVSPITYWEMSDILGGPPVKHGVQPPAVPLLRNPHENKRAPPPRRPLMPMPPALSNEEMPPEDDEPENNLPPERFGPGRPPMGSRFPSDMQHFDRPELRTGIRPPFNRMRGPVRGGARPPRPFGPDGPSVPHRSPMPFRMRHPTPPPRTGSPHVDSGPIDFGVPGCVVDISNLHFRAGLEELLDFFHDYALDEQNIIRRYNKGGQATGEAKINFRSHEDAVRAVKELNHKPIFGRPISLALV